jgi:transcriptional regulator with XRE-family HTH domain
MTLSRKKTKRLESIDWKAVGDRIREIRGFHVTQVDFAQSIGVSQSYLSNMENGRVEVGAAILLSVGQRYGKSLEWLLTGRNESSTS